MNPLAPVDKESVVHVLQATGSRDPDVLHAAKAALVAAVRRPRRVAVAAIVIGGVITLTLTSSLAWSLPGLGLLLAGLWAGAVGSRNLEVIETAYTEYLDAAPPPPIASQATAPKAKTPAESTSAAAPPSQR